MNYQFEDFLTASKIMREAFNEVNIDESSDVKKKITTYKNLLNNCNRLILKRFSDRGTRENLKSHIDNMLMPIFVEKLNGNEKARHELNTPLRERRSLYHYNLNYII